MPVGTAQGKNPKRGTFRSSGCALLLVVSQGGSRLRRKYPRKAAATDAENRIAPYPGRAAGVDSTGRPSLVRPKRGRVPTSVEIRVRAAQGT